MPDYDRSDCYDDARRAVYRVRRLLVHADLSPTEDAQLRVALCALEGIETATRPRVDPSWAAVIDGQLEAALDGE